MTKQEPEEILVFGYVPLFYPGQVDLPLMTDDGTRAREYAEAFTNACERYPYGIDACMWVVKDNKPMAIFAMHKAQEVAAHLLWWTEGDPRKFFRAGISSEDTDYAISLSPIPQATVTRQQVASIELREKTISPDKVHIYFRPVAFSTRNSSTWATIEKWLANETELHILLADTADVQKNAGPDFPDELIYDIGVLEIDRDDQLSAHALKEVQSEGTHPTGPFAPESGR